MSAHFSPANVEDCDVNNIAGRHPPKLPRLVLHSTSALTARSLKEVLSARVDVVENNFLRLPPSHSIDEHLLQAVWGTPLVDGVYIVLGRDESAKKAQSTGFLLPIQTRVILSLHHNPYSNRGRSCSSGLFATTSILEKDRKGAGAGTAWPPLYLLSLGPTLALVVGDCDKVGR